MDTKIKKIIYTIIKIIWILFGVLILVTGIFLRMEMSEISGTGLKGVIGAITLASLWVIILVLFITHIVITLLFLLVKKLIKKIK